MGKWCKKIYAVIITAILAVVLMGTGCGQISSDNSGGKIGIIGAMDEEVRHLKDDTENKKTTEIAGMEFCEGTLEGKKVVIVQCGMGKVNAGICAHTLINRFGCTKIINTGVAGSLQDQMKLGDIVVAVDAVQHDFTVEEIGFEKGEIPYTGRYSFPTDEAMRKTAVEAAKSVAPDANVYEGRICTGDQFIATQEQKDRILADFGGLCCEMEGGAIAQACYLNNTPFVIIRAISDTADDDEYEIFMKTTAINCSRIVEYMVGNM